MIMNLHVLSTELAGMTGCYQFLEVVAEVEFASVELADDDQAENWAEAHHVLNRECKKEFGRSPSGWKLLKREGRWIAFSAYG